MVAVLNQLESAPWVPYLSIICVMGYIFGFAIGPGPIPWIWNTEFFKQSARAGGASEYIYWLSEKSSVARNIWFTEKLSHFLCHLLGLHIPGWSIFPCRSIRPVFKLMIGAQSLIGWHKTGQNLSLWLAINLSIILKTLLSHWWIRFCIFWRSLCFCFLLGLVHYTRN